MKAVLRLTAVCVLSLALFSCQKELSIDTSSPGGGDNNNNDNKLLGNWKFINLAVDVEGSVATNVAGQTVTSVTKYNTVTKNNEGVLSVDATNMKMTGLAYAIQTDVDVKISDGVDEDEMTIPLDFAVPAYSTNSKYQLIGTDSLYFPEGAFLDMPDANGQPVGVSEPSGAKFSINGKTLLISAKAKRTYNVNQQGVISNVTQKADGVITLEKQ